jgi:hypothetical protein
MFRAVFRNRSSSSRNINTDSISLHFVVLHCTKWYLHKGYVHQFRILDQMAVASIVWQKNCPLSCSLTERRKLALHSQSQLSCRLHLLEHWDRGFESFSRHGCLCAFICVLGCSASSIMLSKCIKIKIYKTIILPVVLYRCET